MRILRNTIILLWIGSLLLCGFTVYKEVQKRDTTYPTLSFDSDLVQMELGDSEDKLLSGVTAYDEKDGDLSAEVFVESVSNFIEPGVANVTYVVYDSDHHAAKNTRRVEYLDYTSPRFVLNHSTVFHVGEKVSLTDFVGAEDVIDGDISNNIRFSTSSVSTSSEGLQSITVRVSNSKGDSSELDLSIRVYGDSKTSPEISLRQYILYMKKGGSLSPAAYLKSASKADGTAIPVSEVSIEDNVKKNEAGIYSVIYRVTDENGNQGMTELVVVVEGEGGIE